MEQEYIITVFSENKVGLLSQITTVFTCRNVNIESLTTSESALAGIHKSSASGSTAARIGSRKIRSVASAIRASSIGGTPTNVAGHTASRRCVMAVTWKRG